MVTARSNGNNASRLPALGLRAIVLVILSILVMLADTRTQHLDTVRQALGAAVYPLRLIVDAPARLFAWAGSSTVDRDTLERENRRLKSERLLIEAELQQLTALESENARLRDLLDARDRVRSKVRVAEIMSVDANPYRHTLMINVGTAEGAYDGQAVIDADGVIGQLIDPGLKTSQAVLISDPGHAIPVEVNRNGLRTIAFGTGEIDVLDLPFLPNNADIESGDLLVTSGLGGKFPPGYPVAVVSAVTRIPQEPFADVNAVPAATLNQVREIMLIDIEPPAAAEQPNVELPAAGNDSPDDSLDEQDANDG
ncbi:MAG: rod shape-determining protein MreC [Pseudomonadota bacterium]